MWIWSCLTWIDFAPGHGAHVPSVGSVIVAALAVVSPSGLATALAGKAAQHVMRLTKKPSAPRGLRAQAYCPTRYSSRLPRMTTKVLHEEVEKMLLEGGATLVVYALLDVLPALPLWVGRMGAT